MSNVVEVTAANFDEIVLQSDKPVLIDFWGPSCPHCMPLLPIMDQLAEGYAGRASIAKANLGDNPELRERLGIRGIPLVSFYQGGELHSSLTGAHPRSRYASILDLLVDGGSDEESERIKQETDFLNCVMGKGDAATLEAILSKRPELANETIMLEGRAKTPLRMAMFSATYQIDMLLEAGAKPDHADLAGLGRTEELRAAITADPDLIGVSDDTDIDALAMACMMNKPECAALLLNADKSGERLSIESKNKALGMSCFTESRELAQMLVESGASIEAVTASGTIHFTARAGRVDIVRYLLEHGLDPKSKNNDGVSIVDFVRTALEEKPELQEMLDLLESHRATA